MLDHTVSFFSLQGGEKENSDALACVDLPNGGRLLALADGVGSASNGGDAARLAISTCAELGDNIEISSLFREVDRRIKRASEDQNGQWSTTLTICYIRDQHAKFGHVGDARIYHLRANGLKTRTHDQTEVARLIQEGILSPERALRYHRRHVLLSALNGSGGYELQKSDFDILAGDRILLLSDGVYLQVEKREIVSLSKQHSCVVDFLEALKALLLSRGIADDASALCAEITA